jgi:hypothetical protein
MFGRFFLLDPHGVISQKTTSFIVTAGKKYPRRQRSSILHRPSVFENRVLGTFVPKVDKVTGGWRKLHDEELRDLYASPSVIRIIKSRRMQWVGHGAQMGEKRTAYRLLVGKLEGKRPLRRSKRRWVNDIKLGLVEIGWGGVD